MHTPQNWKKRKWISAFLQFQMLPSGATEKEAHFELETMTSLLHLFSAATYSFIAQIHLETWLSRQVYKNTFWIWDLWPMLLNFLRP